MDHPRLGVGADYEVDKALALYQDEWALPDKEGGITS
jgi:hypothetical protein